MPTDDEIVSIGLRFLARTLPKAEWTHAGHVAAALYLVVRRPEIDVEREMPDLIRAYNESTGVRNTPTGGYHETITQASIRATRHIVASAPSDPLHVLYVTLIASSFGNPTWLLAFWSADRLSSSEARLTWCEPDLVPLPS